MVMGGPAEVPKGFDAETTLYGSRRMVPTLEQSTSLHSQGGAKVCLINPPPPPLPLYSPDQAPAGSFLLPKLMKELADITLSLEDFQTKW